jgi:DNA polymerase III epsilon subunit-like protein
MDKRKNYYITIDTETCGDFGCPLTYDIGFTIHDKKGNIYEKRSYVVPEIFYGQWKKMRTAYYANKIPMYREGIKSGKWIVKSFWDIRKEIFHLIKKYNVKAVIAYNAGFDVRALNSTLEFLTKFEAKPFFNEKTKIYCSWGMACETILRQKTFFKIANAEKWVSECGNVKTSAEVAYRYINHLHDFEEAHTALNDAIIETAIFAKCVGSHKKMTKNIMVMPWKIPQPDFKAYLEKIAVGA